MFNNKNTFKQSEKNRKSWYYGNMFFTNKFVIYITDWWTYNHIYGRLNGHTDTRTDPNCIVINNFVTKLFFYRVFRPYSIEWSMTEKGTKQAQARSSAVYHLPAVNPRFFVCDNKQVYSQKNSNIHNWKVLDFTWSGSYKAPFLEINANFCSDLKMI